MFLKFSNQTQSDYFVSLMALGDTETLAIAIELAQKAGFSNTELHVPRRQLADFRLRDLLPVVIHGASGENAEMVNGIYVRTAELMNGKSIYIKPDNLPMQLFVSDDGKWLATPIPFDAHKSVSWKQSSTLPHPSSAAEWLEMKSGWQRASSLRISTLVRFKNIYNISIVEFNFFLLLFNFLLINLMSGILMLSLKIDEACGRLLVALHKRG